MKKWRGGNKEDRSCSIWEEQREKNKKRGDTSLPLYFLLLELLEEN